MITKHSPVVAAQACIHKSAVPIDPEIKGVGNAGIQHGGCSRESPPSFPLITNPDSHYISVLTAAFPKIVNPQSQYISV